MTEIKSCTLDNRTAETSIEFDFLAQTPIKKDFYTDTLVSLKKETQEQDSKKIVASSSSFFDAIHKAFDWFCNLFNFSRKDDNLAKRQQDSAKKAVEQMKEINKRSKELNDEFEYLNKVQKDLEALFNADPNRSLFLLQKLLIMICQAEGKLREEGSVILGQLISQKQGDEKKIHKEKMAALEQVEKAEKRIAVYDKIEIGITGATITVTGILLVSNAAAIATMGLSALITSPLYIINGVLGGLKAVNTLLKGLSQKDLKQFQAVSHEKNERKKIVRFAIQIQCEDIKALIKSCEQFQKIQSETLRKEHELSQGLRA